MKGKIKLSFLTDTMIVYVENPTTEKVTKSCE